MDTIIAPNINAKITVFAMLPFRQVSVNLISA
jgi:hypothetical protein